jgi:hypothetical protein
MVAIRHGQRPTSHSDLSRRFRSPCRAGASPGGNERHGPKSSQRILIRHGFSRDLGDLLLDDYRRAMEHFDRHPVPKPLTEEESGSFNRG